jgi:pimeloyl-ACP methyl ester carboxylesterase
VPDGYASDAWPFVQLLLLLLVAGGVLWVVAVWWVHRLLHRPIRLTPVRAAVRLGRESPRDLDLPFTDRTFVVGGEGGRPRVSLAAWTLPAKTAYTPRVLLLHGYGESRTAVLPWAQAWHQAGCEVVVPDQRAHGESGGTVTGAGVWEVEDAREVFDTLLAEAEGPVLLAGVSFGAMVASEVAAEREEPAGLVLDSPIRDWVDATTRWAQLFALPPQRARWARAWLTRRLIGRDPPDDATVSALERVRCPTLAILPIWDVLLGEADARRIEALVDTAWQPETTHDRAVIDEPEQYVERLRVLVESVKAAR